MSVSIEGMTCISCAGRLKRTLKALPGVREVEISLADRSASITYRPAQLDSDDIVAAINELGYRAGTVTEVE